MGAVGGHSARYGGVKDGGVLLKLVVKGLVVEVEHVGLVDGGGEGLVLQLLCLSPGLVVNILGQGVLKAAEFLVESVEHASEAILFNLTAEIYAF